MHDPEYHRPENRPVLLYKYLHPDRVDILENLKIRFTQPGAFNDILECYPGSNKQPNYQASRTIAVQRYNELLRQHPSWSMRERRVVFAREMERFEDWFEKESAESSHERLCRLAQLKISAITGTLCLTGKWDNILMWAHYASDHKGFVIEFDGRHEFFNHGFERVIYSAERPFLGGNGRDSGVNGPEVFFTKSADWAYEEEYRKSVNLGTAVPMADGHTFVPFPEQVEEDPKKWPLHLEELPPASIRRVFLGHRMEVDVKNSIRVALQLPRLKHIQLAQAKPHRQYFLMDQLPVK